MDCSLPGSSSHGIFQARVLKWVAISFSRGSSQPRDRTLVSCIAGRHFTLWATRDIPWEPSKFYEIFLFSEKMRNARLESRLPGEISITSDMQEKEMATHSGTLAWEIPWTEEPGRLQSMGSQTVRYDWATSLSLFHCKTFSIIKKQDYFPVIITWGNF